MKKTRCCIGAGCGRSLDRGYLLWVLSIAAYLMASNIFFYIFFPPAAFSKDSSLIYAETIGSVAASADTVNPDELAVEDALKKAVAKAAWTLLSKEELDAATLVLDDKIYSNAPRYIVNYRILSKEVMEGETPMAEGGVFIYNALIEANISSELLIKDLVEVGILHETAVKRVGVAIFNLRSHKVYESLKRGIAGFRGVKNVYYKSFAKDKIELVVEVAGGGETLKQGLMSIYMRGWKIEVAFASGWLSEDRIDIKFFPLRGEIIQ